MTVPVVGSLGLARKPPWRYLPEIHSSRLSFSGSMRPKLGLMILCILLCLSVIALLIPLITKLYQSQVHTDLVISESYSIGDVGGVLSEYTQHVWRPTASSSLIFSPSGISHLVSILSVLRSPSKQRNSDLSNAAVHHQSINNTVQFHVSTKSMYDELEYQLGSMSKSSRGHSSSLLVKLTNRTYGLVEDEMKDLDEGAETLSILASHQVKLEFANIKLTEERYFMSPGVTKKLVMYDIVSRVYIQYIHGVTVIRIQDLNGLILTLITSQGKGDKVNEVLRNIEKFLVEPEEKLFVQKFVRLRIPILSAEGVTQLGDILRHLHSQNNLSSGGSPVQDVQLGRARHIEAQPVSSDVHPSGHLVDQIFTAKANVTHVASLQMTKGPGGQIPVGRVDDTLVFDHRFIYAVHTTNSSLPVILAIFHPKN